MDEAPDQAAKLKKGRPRWWLTPLALLALVGGGYGYVRLVETNAKSNFEEQLRLARAEGIATSAEEFRATLPDIPPSENAAPIWREAIYLLRWPLDLSSQVATQSGHLASHLDQKAVGEAAPLLEKYKKALKLVDDAVKLPHCQFERDYGLGEATDQLEWGHMYIAAQLLAVRGSTHAAENRPKQAIADVLKIFRVAEHMREEPYEIARRNAESVMSMGFYTLASWSTLRPDERSYYEAYRDNLHRFVMPDVRDEHRIDLVQALVLLDQSETAEGRKLLGVSATSREKQGLMSLVFGKARLYRAKAELVKAHRIYWSAYSLPLEQRAARFEEGKKIFNEAIDGFQTAKELFKLYMAKDLQSRGPYFVDTYRQALRVIGMALEKRPIPRTMDTSGITTLSGYPVAYEYDGFHISVYCTMFPDGDEKPFIYRLPPYRYGDHDH